jgi:hypothetical protein
MIVDCHVNIWEQRHLRPLFAEQMARIRPGGMGLKADADTLYAAMAGVERRSFSRCATAIRRTSRATIRPRRRRSGSIRTNS